MDGCDFEECRAIISALPDMVFVLTESGQYAAILGGDSSELYHDGSSLKGVTLFDALPEDKAYWFLDRIKETLANNKLMVFEYSLAADDVETVNNDSGPSGVLRFEGRVNPLKSLRYGERAVVWVARNITERYQLEKQLTYHSEIDVLSGIFNRRKLIEQLNDAFYTFQRYQENYCFLLLDIDDFKKINDNFGHQVGDNAIREIVKICQSELRHTDIIGRLGGDEFGVIHKITTDVCPLALAQRLNNAVTALYGITDQGADKCSISIGISQFDSSDQGIEEIYKRADIALYDSKRKGKNSFSAKLP